MPDTKKMGELHEIYLAELNGGRKSRGSGSQAHDKADGRNEHMTTPFAFAWDGKSTCGKSIPVTREMLVKITEEAHGERPQLGLRFYANERLDRIAFDWVAVRADDFAELLEAARHPSFLGKSVGEEELDKLRTSARADADRIAELLQQRTDQDQELRVLRSKVAELEIELGRLTEITSEPDRTPEHEPGQMFRPPPSVLAGAVPEGTVVIYGTRDGDGRLIYQNAWRARRGQMEPFEVASVRIEPGASNKSMLMVNEQRVHSGQLWIDGQLTYSA
jgi:hypothetical protein